MIEAFFLKTNRALIDAKWREKRLLSSEILGMNPKRALQPEVIGDRTRLDLMWKDGKLGIRDKTDVFAEIKEPDSAHERVREMMNQLYADPLPLNRASLRFRYSSVEDICGLWIDTSNEDIKALKDEGEWLRRQIQERHWVIEAGQKGKEFRIENGELNFLPSRPHCWLPSYDTNNNEIPLLSQAHLFSQPGPEVNRAMIACGFDLLELVAKPILSWAEFGCGYGNLSAAFASYLPHASAYSSEIAPLAVDCLKINAEKFFPDTELELSQAKLSLVKEAKHLWILDPPRPGFPELFSELKEHKELAPRYVLIYHCHSKGLIADSTLLNEIGYKLQVWSCVDAFPATPYHEVISLWKLS